MQPSGKPQQLQAGKVGWKTVIFGKESDLAARERIGRRQPGHQSCPGSYLCDSQQDFDESGLASTVRPQQTKYLPLFDLGRDAVQSDNIPLFQTRLVDLGKIMNLYYTHWQPDTD
jgi:hypothetical protein